MNIKKLFLVCFLLMGFKIITFGQAKDKIAKVVIDAGHGGSMPGAVSKLCKEKDINLKVALRVGKLISDNFEDVTVIYTRKGDETVEVYKRAEIANKNKADLFISIHCNSVDNKSAHGVETFVMGLGKTAESMAIAKKENADLLLEKDYKTNYSDFDPNSPEAYIVFSLYSSAYLNNSAIFASKVQKHLVNNTQLKDRNVQQAGFWVLYKVAMPSILIELGFISNDEEERFLIREETQKLMAESIYNAFVEYKNLTEGTTKPLLPVSPVPKAEPLTAQIVDNQINTDTTLQKNDTIKPLKQVEQPATSVPPATPAPPATSVQPHTNHNVIHFRIQFFSSKENINTSHKKFSSLSDVKKFKEHGVWKYTSGNYKTLAEAQAALKKIKKKYDDAFIIAFNKEQKISVSDAQKLQQ